MGSVKAPATQAARKPGRPTRYSGAIIEKLCMRLIAGASLNAICRCDDMPAKGTVMTWLVRGERGEAPYDKFLQRYRAARELQQELLLDECLDIADDSGEDWVERRREDGSIERVANKAAIHRAKLRIDARFRLAEKLAPKRFGTKVDVNHGPQVENPLKEIVRLTTQMPLLPSEQVAWREKRSK